MSFHVIAPYCTCFLLALSHEEKVTLKETNLSEIEWNWWCSRWFNGFKYLIAPHLLFIIFSFHLRQMWIGRSHCLVKYDRIRLMSWSWQSHLWTQTEKSLETLGMQTECIRCIGCLSKSVKICQAAIFFFACYGLICHGSEWIARFGQGSKADVWLECIHKGNGLASLATLNAAHSGKDPGTMMKYRAQAIHMIYPHIEDLYCILLKLDWRKFGDID